MALPLDPVPAEDVRWHCDESAMSFGDTSEVAPIVGIIGQERALAALQLGLELDGPGYNIFVCGLQGSGRMSSLRAHLQRVRPYCTETPDRAYVRNFHDPFRPRLLELPRRRGAAFARSIDYLLLEVLREVPRILESEGARSRYEEARAELEDVKVQGRGSFESRLAKDGFSLIEVPTEDSVQAILRASVPGLADPVTEEQLEQLVAQGAVEAEAAEQLKERFDHFNGELFEMVQEWHAREQKFMSRVESLRQGLCAPIIGLVCNDLKQRFSGAGVEEYLSELQESILDGIVAFVTLAGQQPGPIDSMTPELARSLYRYRVNVVLDHRGREQCPVLVESQPTAATLFGGVERTPGVEEPIDDFHALRTGALVEADGGFVILHAQDVLQEPGVWNRLKATLRSGVTEILSTDPEGRPTTILKPQPIPIRVKVILVGTFETYLGCLRGDPEFQRIFKIRVDFERDIPVTEQLISRDVPAVIAKIGREERLRPLTRGAVAVVIERGVRWSGRRDRFSTLFIHLADLVREGNYWANVRGSKRVEREDVVRALLASEERASLQEDTSRRRILDGDVLIQVEGRSVGQINSLVVHSLGDEGFGQPVRITARIGMGSEGVINIEREVGLSGQTHDKGVQILSGYLRGQYARRHPLSLAGSICFEQSYGGVDGDSASSTELYALLSAIAGVPLRQDVGVTGSVNQNGEIQSVGGLNEKIEGFFRVVRDLDFPGEPAVMIPRSCLKHLMLINRVVEAIREKKFRVYAIDTVDEGLELLTGMPAGERREDGSFPEGSLHGLVQARLEELAEGLASYRR